jgi:hypothetical protein
MENYIIENAELFRPFASSWKLEDSFWKLEDSFYLSLLPPQRRSVLVCNQDRGNIKLIKVDFPELIFIYYQLRSDHFIDNQLRYITKLKVLNFYSKKEDLLNSLVAPIEAPNCFADGEVCLGTVISDFKNKDLKNYMLDMFFNTIFHYKDKELSEVDSFIFNQNYIEKKNLRCFIPSNFIDSISLKRI